MPCLASFDLRGNGMYVVGGAVCAALFDTQTSDIDIFLVEADESKRTPEVLLGRIQALFRHIDQYFRLHHDRDRATADASGPDQKFEPLIFRTNNCLTFRVNNCSSYHTKTIQVSTTHCFEHIGQMLHSVDFGKLSAHMRVERDVTVTLTHTCDAMLGSSAMAWDGQQVILTSMSRLALEHRVIVVDLDVRQPYFEERLAKYYDRGFGVVMPQLEWNTNKKGLQYVKYPLFTTHRRPKGQRSYPALSFIRTKRLVAATVAAIEQKSLKPFRIPDPTHDEKKIYTATSRPSSDLSYTPIDYSSSNVHQRNMDIIRACSKARLVGSKVVAARHATLCAVRPFDGNLSVQVLADLQPSVRSVFKAVLSQCVLDEYHVDVRSFAASLPSDRKDFARSLFDEVSRYYTEELGHDEVRTAKSPKVNCKYTTPACVY